MKLYHYTTGAHLGRIRESGYLKLTPSPQKLMAGERPLVWLTTDTDMPPTAIKPMRLGGTIHYPTHDELCMYAGIYRFVMPQGLKTAKWDKIVRAYGADPELADVAHRLGESPSTWRATTKRIPIKGLACQVRMSTGEYVGIELRDLELPNIGVEQY